MLRVHHVYYNILRYSKKYNANWEKYNKCHDSEFGCCQIYDDCQLAHDNVSITHDTTLYIELEKKGIDGYNCPFLYDIIADYSNNNVEENCDEMSKDITPYGCCDLSFSCDEYSRPENNYLYNQIIFPY